MALRLPPLVYLRELKKMKKAFKMFILTMSFVCMFVITSFADDDLNTSLYSSTNATCSVSHADRKGYAHILCQGTGHIYFNTYFLRGSKVVFPSSTFIDYDDGNLGVRDFYNYTDTHVYYVSDSSMKNVYDKIDDVGGEGTIPPSSLETLPGMISSIAYLVASVGCLILSLMLLPKLVKGLLIFLR